MNSLRMAAEQAEQDAGLVGAYQLAIDQFLDDFREASNAQRTAMIAATPVVRDGRLAALLAAVVQSLCDESGCDYPDWLSRVGVKSPRPFFVTRPDGHSSAFYAFMDMFDSPPPFFSRNVFVPPNYLSRA